MMHKFINSILKKKAKIKDQHNDKYIYFRSLNLAFFQVSDCDFKYFGTFL